MTELTWQDVDRLERERQEKRSECVMRLAKILSKEFDYQELRFVQYFDGSSILIEAFEIARNKTRG
jgi:hypothetical protein